MKAATYFHMRFETIHPFADGNGRVERTMMNYFLMIHNHPPLIVYDEDREEYYAALEHYNNDEDIELLYSFFMRQRVTDSSFSNIGAIIISIIPPIMF
ncbi:MAG: Fic family protein [Defluviitaleaceae bacterium]|nr:Fic family protein [Defluviitaleaceae bacterium]MCL2255158.1 Fic family protein [Lachnospiraceae bacterium]